MSHLSSLYRYGRTALLVGALLLSAAAVPSAQAQKADDLVRFSQREPISGARLLGRGGASLGGVADYTSLFTNPAGLGFFATSQAAGTAGFIGVENEATFDPLGGALSSTTQSADDVSGGFGLIYKYPTARGSLVLAGGLNQVSTFRRDLSFAGTNSTSSITTSLLPTSDEFFFDDDGQLRFESDLPLVAFNGGAIDYCFADEQCFPGDERDDGFFFPAAVSGTNLQQRSTVEREGRLTEASFGGAVEAARGLMVGATLNLAFGTYRSSQFFEEVDANDENVPADYIVLPEEPANVAQLQGFDALELEETTESDLRGGSFRFGLSGDAGNGLRGGLTVETPTFYTVEQTFRTRIRTSFDETLLDDGTVSEGGFLEYEESGGRSEYERSNRTYDFVTPWRFGAGVSANTRVLTGGAADLTLAADLELVDWTQAELTASPFEVSVNDAVERNYRAVINTRLGAEYRLGDLSLRAGYAYYPDPHEEEDTELPGDETVNSSRTFLSAGLGYRVRQVQVNVGFQQERFDDRYVPYSFNVDDPPIVDEEIIRNRFVLGASYSF